MKVAPESKYDPGLRGVLQVPQLVMVDIAGRSLRTLPFERGAAAAALLEWEAGVEDAHDRWPSSWPPELDEIRYRPPPDRDSAVMQKLGKRRKRKKAAANKHEL
jgi:hypothetical protein